MLKPLFRASLALVLLALACLIVLRRCGRALLRH